MFQKADDKFTKFWWTVLKRFEGKVKYAIKPVFEKIISSGETFIDLVH